MTIEELGARMEQFERRLSNLEVRIAGFNAVCMIIMFVVGRVM